MHHERHEERDPDHEPSDSSDGDEIHRRPPPFGRRPPPMARHPHMPPNHNEPRPHPFHEDHQGYYHNRQREEELFGKLKFTMPTFKGDNDPEEYLSWALKVDKIFRVHNYSEEKMVAMASLEFDGYANQWWEQVQCWGYTLRVYLRLRLLLASQGGPTGWIRLTEDRAAQLLERRRRPS